MSTNRLDATIAQSPGTLQYNGSGTQYLVQTPTGVLYYFYADTGSDLAYKKSTNGGLSWGDAVIVFAGTLASFSLWYDRWSNISAGIIHLAYTETVTSDTLYRTVDTESSDALSTQTVIFAGASAVISGSFLSICRARGGNVYCRTQIDAGAEGGFYRLPNANVPNGAWDAARTINEANASTDMMILMPGWAADNQDMMAFFWDASANEISRQLYDDSANTWSETSIATSMTDIGSAIGGFPHFAGAVDIANSRNLLVAWSAVDTANADLRCWTVTESAITETSTNVVLNSTDDQGFAAIAIDLVTGYWHVFYAGKSDGSENWPSSVNIYFKVSTDSGATWGPETLITNQLRHILWLVTCQRLYLGPPIVAYHNSPTIKELVINMEITRPKATFQLGL